jgi:hypothetical protein
MDENLLPPVFWSVSSCICEIFPDSWVFTWVTDQTARRHEAIREILQLSEADFFQMQTRFDWLLDNDEFGWPNVFLDADLARDFYASHLDHLPNIKLLSIALPEVYWTEFIEESAPSENVGESGVRRMLRKRQAPGASASVRGFEILGFEMAGFHSFVCNSLETDYHARLDITLRPNGLIGDYEDAVRAADYTALDEVMAEPALWRPWLVSEHSLDSVSSIHGTC